MVEEDKITWDSVEISIDGVPVASGNHCKPIQLSVDSELATEAERAVSYSADKSLSVEFTVQVDDDFISSFFEQQPEFKEAVKMRNQLNEINWKYQTATSRKERRKLKREFNALFLKFLNHCAKYGIKIKIERPVYIA